MLSYNGLVRTISNYVEQREEELVVQLYQSLDQMFDNKVFEKMVNGLSFNRPEDNPQLMSTDKIAINELCNRVHFLKNANLYFSNASMRLITEAKNALEILKSEYHLKD